MYSFYPRINSCTMEINSQTDSIASPFCHIQNANFRHLLKLITFTFHGNCRYHCLCYIFSFLGDVCMTTGQNSPWDEFASATCCGSVFVYTMPPENVMPARVHRSRFLYCSENFMPEKKNLRIMQTKKSHSLLYETRLQADWNK